MHLHTMMRSLLLLIVWLGWSASMPHRAAAEAAPLKIVMLGDSITKGVRAGVTATETFSSQIEQQLQSHWPSAQVINGGIGGERTDQAWQRLESIVVQQPTVVAIMYGTNDSYVDSGAATSRLTPQQYADNLTRMIERLRAAEISVILMTPPRWSPQSSPNGLGENPNKELAVFVQACRHVAKQLKVPLVDHFAHWTSAESAGQSIHAWTTDGCHPNRAGHKELARRIEPVLEKLLRERERSN